MKLVHFVCIGLLLASSLGLAQSPAPFISQPLVPMTTAPGGPGFTLTVNGANFVSGSVINWNGNALATTFVSRSQLTATVPAANIATAGTAAITVLNPGSGGLSNVEFFQVATSVSSLTFTLLGSMGFDVHGVPPVVSGDFNGDGKVDLAVLYFEQPSQGLNSICIMLGNGDGSFQGPRCASPSGNNWQYLTTGDFNGDGKLDIAVTDRGNNQVDVFLGNGDGTLQSPKTSATGPVPGYIVDGDFNGDGKLDLAIADFGDNSLSILLGNGDGTFGSPATYSGNSGALAVGDFNGDGILDLVVGGTNASVLLGNGDGTFHLGAGVGSGIDLIIDTADLNGDGKLDLVSLGCGTSFCVDMEYVALLGNGDGTFQTQVHFGEELGNGVYPTSIVLADMNADGKLDVVANAPDAFVVLGNGDGTFQNPIILQPYFFGIAADFNNDGRADLTGLEGDVESTLAVTLQGSFAVPFTAPNSLAFGPQETGTTSSPQTVVLTNVGMATLTLSSITITGANAGDFAQANTCGPTLAVNANCQIKVTFAPTAGGNRSALVSIAGNAPGSPQTVPLTGSAIVPDFSVTATSPTSQTVTPGQAANYTVTVSPVNGFSKSVTLSCSGAPAGSTCTVTPGSVALDGTHSATANVAVVTMGASMGLKRPAQRFSGERLALWLGISGVPGLMVLGGIGWPRKRKLGVRHGLAILCLFFLVVTWSGCGGGGGTSSGGQTKAGTYNLLVTGTFTSGSTSLMHTAQLSLVVQ